MMTPILPGRTLGIVGGGQLGRMFALAARRMGYRIHVFEPVEDSPAGQLADSVVCADYQDVDAARRFARDVDVVTFEFENIPAETLAAIAEDRPVRPSPEVLHICRHRLREKDYLQKNGFPLSPYRAVASAVDLGGALSELGIPAILKTADFGYDGKGQARINCHDGLPRVWAELGRPQGVLEAFVPFTKEISVICARDADGNMLCFGPAENEHARHILDITTVPAGLSPTMVKEAIELACAITESLKVIGLLAVEMFVVGDKLLVNELAPRPHNSGHYTLDACVTSQFEQQLRAVCGLPLGDVSLCRPAAMANLLGDLWQGGEPNWAAALALPEVKLHLYGKREARPGRKMGHLTATAGTTAQARDMVVAARERLVISPGDVRS
jgi:5-(carboxyamino)imidazole ribonucleotide synthase